MKFKHLLFALGFALLLLVINERNCSFASWTKGWLGLNFLALGVAHAKGYHGLFGKRSNGTLPWWSWFLFFPLLMLTLSAWHLQRFCRRAEKTHQVNEQLVLGRRLLGFEVTERFDTYVDLTAEFTEPAIIRRAPGYVCFPILDGSAPSAETSGRR